MHQCSSLTIHVAPCGEQIAFLLFGLSSLVLALVIEVELNFFCC